MAAVAVVEVEVEEKAVRVQQRETQMTLSKEIDKMLSS
jgi:hypothetical protein